MYNVCNNKDVERVSHALCWYRRGYSREVGFTRRDLKLLYNATLSNLMSMPDLHRRKETFPKFLIHITQAFTFKKSLKSNKFIKYLFHFVNAKRKFRKYEKIPFLCRRIK